MSYIDAIIESKRKELLDESILINEKDIYYNKEKFDSGEINLCFITGHSGSGKSTMGRDMESKNIEHYDLDDLQCIKDYFTMDKLKEYGDLIYSYFNGPGKKFYITYKELINNETPCSEYEDKMFPEFVNYAKKYAAIHKDRKFVLEGIWFFSTTQDGKPWFKPEEFKDYAFYIKGTSMIISKLRAAKRDSKDAKNKWQRIGAFVKNFFTNNWKYYYIDERRINVFRKYFSSLSVKSISESVDKSILDKNFKKKTGGNFKYIDIRTNKSVVQKYLSTDKQYNKTYKKHFDSIDGEIVIDTDNNTLAGYVFVIDMFITPLFIYPKYRGYGLGDILTKDAVKKYKARRLWVFKDNEVAIKLYKKHSFKVFYEDDEPSILMATEEKYARDVIESLNESSDNSKVIDIPKEIKDLLKILNSYDYGYISKGKKVNDMKNFFNEYKSLTISEFEKYKIGVCWDYVHYEAYWFKKHGYKFDTFYIQVQDEANMCPSHTYLVFYLPNSNKVYYFESSWGKYQGIEEFDNIDKLHETVKKRHIESSKSKCYPDSFFREKYNAYSSEWEGLSCGKYMNKISKGRIAYQESNLSFLEESSSKKCRIICPFAGTGKNYAINYYKKQGLVVNSIEKVDKFSRQFGTDSDYIKLINKTASKSDILFIPYFLGMEKEILKGRIDYCMVYPDKSLKSFYLRRFKDLEFTDEQIANFRENWDDMIDECESCKNQIRLKKNDYLLDVLEKSIQEATTTQIQLYFISTKENIKSLSPRIPDNFFTRKGYEDNKTPRVCFSTDIGKCLMGLSSRCAGQKYYVYQPAGEYEIITPTKKQVPDVEITDEKWICEKVEIQCIGEIICIGDKGEDGIPYTYGPKNEYKAELYEWNWKWVKKYNKEGE